MQRAEILWTSCYRIDTCWAVVQEPARALGAPSTLTGVLPDDASPAAHADGPASDGGGLDDLYDIARLARRLGVENATIRVWLSRKVPWLPPPDGRLNGGAVWRATTLDGIENRRYRRRPGRKPRFTTAPAAADVARTGSIPVVTAPTPVVPVPARAAEAPDAGRLPTPPHGVDALSAR